MLWTLESRELPLRYTWKISRNASDTKTNLFVRVQQAAGGAVGWGEAAPNVRYNESPESLQREFEQLVASGLDKVTSLAELTEFTTYHSVAHALSFALESAYVHWQAASTGQSVAAVLGLPEPSASVPTALTLPIMAPSEVAAFIQAQDMGRFSVLKIKVDQASGYELLREVTRILPGRPLIIDGNEAWTDADALLQFLEKIAPLPGLAVRLLEQPLPAACTDHYRYLRPRSPYPVFADESVTNEADFGEIAEQFHGVNMKLMKAGGYRNGLHLLSQTRAHGLDTMLGCMVETSLGIWGALQVSSQAQVCDLDGFLVVRDEPFGFVREENGQLSAQLAVPNLEK
ncbi:enolase C-terminal domain-like protein [Hymenobacter sp. HD11105]|jgi:L-alanine-DL-glutamate epimerase-like enolase superfamily enzyme